MSWAISHSRVTMVITVLYCVRRICRSVLVCNYCSTHLFFWETWENLWCFYIPWVLWPLPPVPPPLLPSFSHVSPLSLCVCRSPSLCRAAVLAAVNLFPLRPAVKVNERRAFLFYGADSPLLASAYSRCGRAFTSSTRQITAPIGRVVMENVT